MQNTVAILCTAALIVCLLYVSGNLGIVPQALKQREKQIQQAAQAQQNAKPAGPLSDIEIYVSSECVHCVSMKPEIDKLKDLAAAEKISYRLISPADDDLQSMMSSRNVQFFPCVLLKGTLYQGERSAVEIMKALKAMK